jgi:hypothetical protein
LLEPKIEEVQPAPHVTWRIDEGALIVEDVDCCQVAIDLTERQTDSEVVIDITRDPQHLKEGIHGPYVLSVIIPPRRYREELGEPSESGDTGTVTQVPEPLDVASVTVRLWNYAGANAENTETEMM